MQTIPKRDEITVKVNQVNHQNLVLVITQTDSVGETHEIHISVSDAHLLAQAIQSEADKYKRIPTGETK